MGIFTLRLLSYKLRTTATGSPPSTPLPITLIMLLINRKRPSHLQAFHHRRRRWPMAGHPFSLLCDVEGNQHYSSCYVPAALGGLLTTPTTLLKAGNPWSAVLLIWVSACCYAKLPSCGARTHSHLHQRPRADRHCPLGLRSTRNAAAA